MAINIEAAQGVGAYVSNLELCKVDEATAEQLQAALAEYGVLFFKEQSLSPEQQISLGEKFGSININRFFAPVDGHPKIAQVLKEPTQTTNIGEKWHTDHSYDEKPALGSILVARVLPSQGGDTIFVNMAAAYAALSDEMKQKILPLKALHSSRHTFGKQKRATDDYKGRLGNPEAATQDTLHPLVISHPVSHRPVLFINPGFTVSVEGLEKAESDALLEALYSHALQPQFQHRFKWQPGSVVFWDNRGSWHSAQNDYHGERRLMHRITIEGEALASFSCEP